MAEELPGRRSGDPGPLSRPAAVLAARGGCRPPSRNVATSFFGKKTTYAELVKQVDQFSRALVSLGVKKGDRVALVLPNCPQYVIAYYAAARIGAVFVGNNPLYTERELIHQLNDCGAEVWSCSTRCTPSRRAHPRPDAARGRHRHEASPTTCRSRSTLAPIELKKDAKKHGEPWPPVPADADVEWWKKLMQRRPPAARRCRSTRRTTSPALIYTGGTTGLSKGAMLTHANLVANAMQGAAWFPDLRDGRESVMCVLPFFHSYGMTVCMNLGILQGGEAGPDAAVRAGTHAEGRSRRRSRRSSRACRGCTSRSTRPTETPKYDLRSITRVPLRGGPAAAGGGGEVRAHHRRQPGRGVRADRDVAGDARQPRPRHAPDGTIGLPITDTDCRVVELDDWTEDVAPGEPGELIIAGPQVMKGYWNRPDETELMMKHDAEGRRWLLTGDVAVDGRGGLLLHRRPDEGHDHRVRVQRVSHGGRGGAAPPPEGRSRSRSSASPTSTTGEAVKAFIVLREGEKPGVTVTEKDIIDFAGDPEHGLSRYRVPKQIEFRNSLPETMIGKVLRRVLVAEERERAKAATRGPVA